MKKRSHRCDINRLRPRNRHKYTNYKMYVSMMMIICSKQHLSNIWSSSHEKVKQQLGWVEKKMLLIKKSVYLFTFNYNSINSVQRNDDLWRSVSKRQLRGTEKRHFFSVYI